MAVQCIHKAKVRKEKMIDEPKQIETEIEQACARLQSHFAGYKAPIEKAKTPDEISVSLEKGGYPKRHRVNLQRMHGPSLEKAKELSAKVVGGNCLLLIVGGRGPGKTQMATYWAAERAKQGKSRGRYVKCADLIGEIKAVWQDGGKKAGTEEDVLRKYRETPYLVIDELHERGASDWEARVLVNIIDHRYDDMLATVLIGNFDVEKIDVEINRSIVSRAQETGGLIVADWPSYRSTSQT